MLWKISKWWFKYKFIKCSEKNKLKYVIVKLLTSEEKWRLERDLLKANFILSLFILIWDKYTNINYSFIKSYFKKINSKRRNKYANFI